MNLDHLEYVTIERDGPIAIVTFDRHKNLNAFDGQLILELTEVARAFHHHIQSQNQRAPRHRWASCVPLKIGCVTKEVN